MEPFQLRDVLYTGGVVYYIKDSYVELFSSETCYGWKTFAEVDREYHYLNDQLINIYTAINLWQDLNKILLSLEEIRTIMDNNISRLGA